MPKLNIVVPPTEEKEESCGGRYYDKDGEGDGVLYKVSCGHCDYGEDGEVIGMWTDDDKLFKSFPDAEKHYKEEKKTGEWGHIQFDCLDIEMGDNFDEDIDDYEELDCEGIDCYIAPRQYETNYIFYVKQYLQDEFPKQNIKKLVDLAAIYETTSGDDIQITVDRKTNKWVSGDETLKDFIQVILLTFYDNDKDGWFVDPRD